LKAASILKEREMKSIVIVTAAAAIASSLASTAIAGSLGKDPVVTEQISYADLNLSSSHDQQRLRDRISFAAYRLCLIDPGASPSPALADDSCARRVRDQGLAQMARAVAAVDNHQMLASAAQRR
jgi:UrcA family protein